MVLVQLGFEAAEQREGIGGRPGKSCEDFFLIEPANLLSAVLDDGLAQRDLAIPGHNDGTLAADTQYGGGANSGRSRARSPVFNRAGYWFAFLHERNSSLYSRNGAHERSPLSRRYVRLL